MDSLLDVAKKAETKKPKRTKDPSAEEVELALAWARREVTMGQVAAALQTSTGMGVYSVCARALACWVRGQGA